MGKKRWFSTKIVPLQNAELALSPYNIINLQFSNNNIQLLRQITGIMRIKNIIFDFGGVIHDIRYENVVEAFARHGVTGLGKFYSKDFQTKEMDQFEKGLITPAEYRNYIRRMTGKEMTDSVIDEIVNAILIDVPRERVELLQRLRSHYRLFLFSNTNQINYDCFTVRLKEKFGFDIFERCFDAAYFSHFMHTRKPSPEGFERIIREQGLVPDETVFIDDIAKNLEGAEAVGIHGLHLAQGTIVDLFDNKGNISNSTFGSNYKR